jgi:hypothetical protein
LFFSASAIQGITTAPVVTVAAEQAHYFTFALNDQGDSRHI